MIFRNAASPAITRCPIFPVVRLQHARFAFQRRCINGDETKTIIFVILSRPRICRYVFALRLTLRYIKLKIKKIICSEATRVTTNRKICKCGGVWCDQWEDSWRNRSSWLLRELLRQKWRSVSPTYRKSTMYRLVAFTRAWCQDYSMSTVNGMLCNLYCRAYYCDRLFD